VKTYNAGFHTGLFCWGGTIIGSSVYEVHCPRGAWGYICCCPRKFFGNLGPLRLLLGPPNPRVPPPPPPHMKPCCYWIRAGPSVTSDNLTWELQKGKEELEEDNTELGKETVKSKKELEMWEKRMQRVKIQLKRMRRQMVKDGHSLLEDPRR